jgi:hypothetical protein
LVGTPLFNLIKTQDKNLNLYSPDYTLIDWGKLRFEKEFDFDYQLDYTELLDDKAISCIRSEIRTVYNRTVLGYTPKKATTSRRVLTEVLNMETLDVRKICGIIQRDEIPYDWRIILIHAKQREFKIAPRRFAMMVLEMRVYFRVTEANIA